MEIPENNNNPLMIISRQVTSESWLPSAVTHSCPTPPQIPPTPPLQSPPPYNPAPSTKLFFVFYVNEFIYYYFMFFVIFFFVEGCAPFFPFSLGA